MSIRSRKAFLIEKEALYLNWLFLDLRVENKQVLPTFVFKKQKCIFILKVAPYSQSYPKPPELQTFAEIRQPASQAYFQGKESSL